MPGFVKVRLRNHEIKDHFYIGVEAADAFSEKFEVVDKTVVDTPGEPTIFPPESSAKAPAAVASVGKSKNEGEG